MAEKALTAVIQDSYIQGVSTRSVDGLGAIDIQDSHRSFAVIMDGPPSLQRPVRIAPF